MTEESGSADSGDGTLNRRLALLLAMAMFVLVVDTSLMNVSISAVVRDLDTTVSGVQSAIALEALVSAAFILIGSKVGDLFGRKRAYVLGLLGYAVGALAMTLANGLAPVIIFWAVVGGLGASMLLPAMQSLIHGNFTGTAQKQVYALVGAAAAIAAAVGPLLGGFITTYLSWRVAFGLEVIVIAIVLSGIGLVHDAPYTGSREVDPVGAALSVLGMGGVVLGILVWQEGGEFVVALLLIGVAALAGLVYWLVRRKRERKPTLLDPDLFKSKTFRLGISGQMLQQIALGGTMIALADLSADGPGVRRDAGRPVHRPTVAQHVRDGVARRETGWPAASGKRYPVWLPPAYGRPRGIAPHRAPSVVRVVPPGPARDCWLGAGFVGVTTEQLHTCADQRGACQRGGRRELGGRIVRAVVRVGVLRGHHAGDAIPELHQHGGSEHGALPGPAAAGGAGARGRRASDE